MIAPPKGLWNSDAIVPVFGARYSAGDGGTPSSGEYLLARDKSWTGAMRLIWLGPWRVGGVYSLVDLPTWQRNARKEGHRILSEGTIRLRGDGTAELVNPEPGSMIE